MKSVVFSNAEDKMSFDACMDSFDYWLVEFDLVYSRLIVFNPEEVQ